MAAFPSAHSRREWQCLWRWRAPDQTSDQTTHVVGRASDGQCTSLLSRVGRSHGNVGLPIWSLTALCSSHIHTEKSRRESTLPSTKCMEPWMSQQVVPTSGASRRAMVQYRRRCGALRCACGEVSADVVLRRSWHAPGRQLLQVLTQGVGAVRAWEEVRQGGDEVACLQPLRCARPCGVVRCHGVQQRPRVAACQCQCQCQCHGRASHTRSSTRIR